MTIRSILLGLLGAVFVCSVTYFNDAIMQQTMFVGNNMPVAVYGGLIIFVLLINPILFRCVRNLALNGRELAVILTLTLAACCIPGSGLLRTFSSSIILPHHFNKTESGWAEQGIIQTLPTQMLVNIQDNEEEVLQGFVTGLAIGSKHISLTDIPLYAWKDTLCFWLPVILALWIGLIGLSAVVHRQWADHEQLPYPIAAFANSLLPSKDRPKGTVFNNKLFWLGAMVILVIHLSNYTYAWFPSAWVKIPTQFNFGALGELIPSFVQGGGKKLLAPQFYFTAVAFAYFLATDVSFALGIGPFIYVSIVGILIGYGISMAGSGFDLKYPTFLNAGAYFGMLLIIIYTGRFYYVNVFKKAFFLPAKDDVKSESVWGARVFMIAMIVFVSQICSLGVDWPIAVMYTFGTVMMFLVMSRIVVETGLFYLQSWWFPGVIIWGFFGAKALGPETMLILFTLSSIILIDPRESLMPFIVNSFKLLDFREQKIGKASVFCVIAIFLGLTVGLMITLYFQYDRGVDMNDYWASRMVPRKHFTTILDIKQRLIAQGGLEEASTVTGWGRFSNMSPSPSHIMTCGLGIFLVLSFTFARLRLTKWPIHPVLFLIWATYPARRFAASFLLGWFIKLVVTKYGGESAYRKLKPLMFGLIAGDMLGGIIPMIIGAIYYLITKETPPKFLIMPG